MTRFATNIAPLGRDTMKELKLPSSASAIPMLHAFIERVIDENPRFSDLFGNVLMALTEAVNNSIEHGNRADESKQVTINLREEPDLLEFSISDEGEGFSMDRVTDPTLPENIEKTSGRGIFIIRRFADSVQYLRNGATVVLTFLSRE